MNYAGLQEMNLCTNKMIYKLSSILFVT
jgi:hypothetical protein